MKKTFALWLLGATLVAGIAMAGFAQNTMTTPNGNTGAATADQRPPKLPGWPVVWSEVPVQISTHCMGQGCNVWILRVTDSTSRLFSIRRSGWLS